MEGLRKSMTTRFHNFPLHRKILSLVLFVILLTLLASFTGIRMVSASYNRLLYKALAGSLSYTASNISTKLAAVESMSNAIISNKNIQKNLITLTDESGDIKIRNAESMLDYLIFDYQQANRTSRINYINLYNSRYVSQSFAVRSRETPDAVHDAVIKAANKKAGYPVWITEYADEYGLFLGRDCRRVNQMKFDTLGTLVVSVDLEKLIRTSTDSILMSDAAQYILYDNGHVIYRSRELADSSPEQINQKLLKEYDVLEAEGKRYFCVQGTLSSLPWKYICLIPYDEIAGTLRISLLLSAAVILFSALICLIFSRLIASSINSHFTRLLTKMDAFGKDESAVPDVDYDYSSRTDEVGVLHNQFDKMAGRIHQLIQENYINEILTRDARLKALENQINPHFLYNTLESVNWRAKAIGEKDISAMVESLGALLRITLSRREERCTVEHELDIVHNYITIQQIRFEDRLVYEEEIDPGILTEEIPQLTIQPLVENAICHVLEEITAPCRIQVQGLAQGTAVLLRVVNNGSQFEEDTLRKLEDNEIIPSGFGIGLINIHRRIQLTYGPDYGLKLYNSDREHAVAQIRIPRRNYDKIIDR